ncbi:hypothetical protein B0T18DRAFT_420652 [Schizothecium vesticola]|uniref:Modin n=1 Tax=Schizothecium vesticola TaxID=314040 RepID=A0AA40BP53_9PEZI|nr:hypothetical protein B0T18DRAFT_420652 [Schizothecium vesticola]
MADSQDVFRQLLDATRDVNSTLGIVNDTIEGNDSNLELILAISAMVISVAAFFVSILQALQQYYASATGYSSCGPQVIGKWAQFRHRILIWYEFRFEVQFEVPVIFVARPSNQNGPMGHTSKQKIVVLDGSKESYLDSRTQSTAELDHEFRKQRNAPTTGVHTADNEAATWLGMLVAIQRMEDDSRKWQQKALTNYDAPANPEGDGTVAWPPKAFAGHDLIVCIQRKKKSWDTIPDHITKPYATTTIAHLVEMMAMLGIYWKVMDRANDRYLAQGNGFIVSGSNVDALGLTFTFTKKGPTWFEANRVVPHYDVKELCFGLSPTTFRGPGVRQYADEPKGLGTLQLGSMDDIAESLTVLGCNVHTVNFFRRPDANSRHGHLFPLAFELLGMIGVVLQVKGTVFRTLPNPTPFRWDPKSFELITLLTEYDRALTEMQPRGDGGEGKLVTHPLTKQGEMIQGMLHTVTTAFAEWNEPKDTAPKTKTSHSDSDLAGKNGEKTTTVAAAAATSNDVEKQGAFLSRRRLPFLRNLSEPKLSAPPPAPKVDVPIPANAIYSPQIFEALHTALEACDTFLDAQNSTSSAVLRLVLRAHVQAALDVVNAKAPAPKHDTPAAGTGPAVTDDDHPGKEDPREHIPTIQELDAASDHKHALLMDLYFRSVRARVVDRVCDRLQKQKGSMPMGSPTLRRSTDFAVELARKQPRSELEEKVSDVWCTLVFRALCWLLLHHFHEKDVQVEKSDLYESRQPVYIL